jgi:hypothetical protein
MINTDSICNEKKKENIQALENAQSAQPKSRSEDREEAVEKLGRPAHFGEQENNDLENDE